MKKFDNSLLLVEWEDSTQPLPSWCYLEDPPSLEIIKRISVGWIIKESDKVLMLAPNIGDCESDDNIQGSGFIRIPKSAIIKTTNIYI